MARSYLHTSLALVVAFVSGCGNAGHSAADVAGQPGIADPTAPTAPAADADQDGLAADQDLCPNTPAGVNVDGNGCSTAQRDANDAALSEQGSQPNTNGALPSGSAAAQAVADGAVAPNGFAVFVLDPQGAVPVTLRTLASNVSDLADGGFALSGTVLIDAPGNAHITLAEAKLQLSYDAAKGEGLQGFQGSARVPFPDLGFMSGVSVSDPVYASVGFDLGSNIKNVNAPLKDERKYLFFTFSAGFSAQLKQLTVSAAKNQSVTMTLDVSDPAFFLRASLGGLMGPIDEASVGFSIGGHLPFTPTNTWGVEDKVKTFDGHLWLGGKINLNDLELPLAIGGNTVVNLDPNADGKTLFSDPAGGFKFGSNSELDVSVSAGILSFELPVATSTVIGSIVGKNGTADYSGLVKSDNAWIPVPLPLKLTSQLKVAGHASTKLTDTYLKGQGDMALDAGKLGQWTGLNLSDLAMAEASFNADASGVRITGNASTSISPYLGLKGDLAAEAYFTGRPADWYVTMDGQFAISGVELASDAHARLDQSGMIVKGTFLTPISKIAMQGSIGKTGVDIEGSATVTIPITGGKDEVQLVTNAAVCGYETVTDAGLCGSQTVANGAVCGYNTVTSAAECGTSTVQSAAQCGASTLQSAAQCGTRYLQSAAACGVSTFNDVVHCGVSCLTSIFSSCSCSIANSCYVANTCTVANTCKVANTCNVPKSCSVANSCQKVKTCEQHVTVPDFNYGSFAANVTVKIGDSGLEGSVSGQYCAVGGSCSTLVGGRVKVSSGAPEACITVPSVGEVCAPF